MERPLYSHLVRYYELLEGRDWESEIRLITSVLRENDCASIVDLGCGTGYHVRALSRLGFDATGIDISKQNVHFARKKAVEEKIHARFVIGSYYDYRPTEKFDAAICLNWSIPVVDGEIRRFLDNTHSLLQRKGILIFDFEKVSDLVWSDVGLPITESWKVDGEVIVRVSVGQVSSNVLSSRDVYLIYPKNREAKFPNESSRYRTARERGNVRVHVDNSYVRFFSLSEIRRFAKVSGFKMIANTVLPRKEYKRNYAILKKFD